MEKLSTLPVAFNVLCVQKMNRYPICILKNKSHLKRQIILLMVPNRDG